MNAAAFYSDWEDLQLNLPDPLVPAQFYIANVGGATAAGVELEAAVRAHRHLDLFGADIPVAFAYGTFAPSGFVGEPGRPRTFGVSVGVRF